MSVIYHRPFALTLLAAVFALAAAFISQYVFGLAPCVLCLYQRWPYAVIIVLSLLGLYLAGKPPAPTILMFAVGIAFLTTSGIGAFHVGVEQGWWEGTTECVGDTSTVMSIDALRQQIETAPVVRCSDIAWSLFGISMAGYNMIAALILAVFSFSSINRKSS